MNLTVSNTEKSKLNILSITLIINYCASLYLTLSNNFFGNLISKLTLLLVMLHSLLYFYYHRNSKKLLIWVAFYFVVFYAYMKCKRREILDLYVYISFYSDVDKYKINSRINTTATRFFLATVFLSIVHILPTAPPFFRDASHSLTRFTLGFNHPNAGGQLLLIIASTAFVRDYSSKNRKTLFFLIGEFVISNYIFRSRASSIIILLLILIYLLRLVGIHTIERILKLKCTKYFIILFAAVTVCGWLYISNHYDSFQKINALLGSRIENNFLFLSQYSVYFWGNADLPTWLLAPDQWGLRYLDSGYMQLILGLGLFNTVFFFSLLLYALSVNIKERNVEIIILLTIIIFLLIVEAAPLRWYFSFSLLYTYKTRNATYLSRR